jgi:hypothetical protein
MKDCPDFCPVRYEGLSVMIICVQGEERRHEAYVQNGKAYISVAF